MSSTQGEEGLDIEGLVEGLREDAESISCGWVPTEPRERGLLQLRLLEAASTIQRLQGELAEVDLALSDMKAPTHDGPDQGDNSPPSPLSRYGRIWALGDRRGPTDGINWKALAERRGKALEEAHACFEAAMVEGWIDALENGEIEAIRDFWNRRVSYAYSALSALSDGLSGGREEGKQQDSSSSATECAAPDGATAGAGVAGGRQLPHKTSATAPSFWFAERGFENSRTPCICVDDPRGGDPLIIAQLQPNEFWPNYVNAMCDAATRCFRMADELSEHLRKQSTKRRADTHIDRECALLGHEFALEPDADEDDPMTCIHCGAERSDA